MTSLFIPRKGKNVNIICEIVEQINLKNANLIGYESNNFYNDYMIYFYSNSNLLYLQNQKKFGFFLLKRKHGFWKKLMIHEQFWSIVGTKKQPNPFEKNTQPTARDHWLPRPCNPRSTYVYWHS